MKVIIFTIKNPGDIYLTNRVNKEFNVVGMVILSTRPRTRKQKLDYWKRKIKRYGFFKTLNKYLFIKFPLKDQDTTVLAKSFFHPGKEKIDFDFQTDTLNTHDINSDEVIDFIKSKAPDVIAVCGSNLIKPEVFSLAKRGTVNIHAGITPDYRCANPVEWALFNKDYSKIGVTIHYVNEGLDTGDIIYQQQTIIDKNDTIDSIYYKNILNGAELMVKALADIETGTVKALPQSLNKGKHYWSIDFGFWQNLVVKKILKSIY